MQTRPYVPGKNLWAALTARLTRDYPDKEWNKGYKNVGCCVQEQFLFGYLWPCLDESKPCFFWDHYDFDYLFLDSYASAALDYSAYSTEEGSLHETEFIAPVARNGKPVYLVGDLWAKNAPIEAKYWQKSLENLPLGGERTYGWGRIALCSELKGNSSMHGKTATGHEWQEQDGKILITLNRGERIKAHALASGDGAVMGVVGPVEPIVGRDWDNDKGSHMPCYESVYYVPGCEVTGTAEVVIDTYGRWNASGK